MTLFVVFLTFAGTLSAATSIELPALRSELLEMQAQDQALRGAQSVDVKAIIASDKTHTARMKSILSQHGWPKRSLVGEDGASAAWLLVQHADADPAFQRQALALMKPLLRSGEIRRPNYAYLWDRTHEPQRYGTQGACVAKGKWQPNELESTELVESHRRKMEMEPLSEYVSMASVMLCKLD